jgi:hypothetical protein
MDRVKQNSKGVNTQKCNSAIERFSGETILHGIAGVYRCTGIVVSTKANIVVRAQTGTVVRSCSRMAMRACSGNDEKRQTGKPVRECVYKSIIINILKDSKQ